MAKHLAIYQDTTGNQEFYGFRVMTTKEVSSYEELLESISWEINYFTCDEDTYITYYNGEELLNRIEFKEIKNEEYSILNELFENGFGYFPDQAFLESIIDRSNETEDEDDYEDD